jgi:hypothetical protein
MIEVSGGAGTRRVQHGARSEPTVKRRATNRKRTLLRQLGLRQQDLDGIGRALLEDWAKAQAVVGLYFDHADRHGWLDEGGNQPGWTATFFAATNTSRLTLMRLSEHLRRTGRGAPSMVAALQLQAQRGNVVPLEKARGRTS